MCDQLEPDVVAAYLEELPMLLWAERERRHMSQNRAADEIGIHQQEWARYELGQHSPRLGRLLLLLDWLAASRKLPVRAVVAPRVKSSTPR